MEKEIKVAVNFIKVEIENIVVDFPETATYYKNTNATGMGIELLAVLPKFKQNPTKCYYLVHVKQNMQHFIDFYPGEDCQTEYFNKKSEYLRTLALKIFRKHRRDFTQIGFLDFETERNQLLNEYKERLKES